MEKIVTQNPRATQKLGEKIGRSLQEGGIVALSGKLGSGKTTFVQGLAKGLGIKKRILSPTFVLIRSYTLSPTPLPRRQAGYSLNPRPSTFYHIDLYRINSPEEAGNLGLEEIWSDPQNIVAIEWAEKIKKILPKQRMDIFFKYKGENIREIHFNTLK